MNQARGQALPLGIQYQGYNINFSIAVEQGVECKLNLYKKGIEEPSYTFIMEADPIIKGIRFIQVVDIDKELTEYNYEIDHQMVVDPYALEIVGRKVWGSEEKEQVRGKIAFPMPLEVDKHISPKAYELPIPEEEVIAYRLHVRGFTKHTSSKVKAKGSFQGLVEKISYLKELGVNQIQLLPCFEFIEEGRKINYWGYTNGFYMSPKSAYSYTDNVRVEFAQMVQAFHNGGFEVILDIPFVDSPSLMFQMECLRHYVLEYQIDGFVLNSYITNLEEVKQDPILAHVKIMCQQDDFQIAMRKFLKGDEGMVKEVIWQLRKETTQNVVLSYNYITNHNGFTMQDLVSYDGKHNEANGEKNQDGNEYNYCWNCGIEGPSRKKTVLDLRKKQVRNAWALLLLSQGTPCILSGDEFGNTQLGNNNTYCQDNEISWLDWKYLSRKRELHTFVKKLIKLRREHPVLHQGKPISGLNNQSCGLPNISYHGEAAWVVPDEVSSRQLGVLYSGRDFGDADCYVAYNMHWVEHEYALPVIDKNKKWYRILDTSTGMVDEEETAITQRSVIVTERSIAMFICK